MSSGYDMGIDTSRRNVKPRPLTDNERARLEEFLESIHYSSRSVAQSRYCHRLLPALLTDKLLRISYSDSEFEYRHVQLPKAMLKAIPKEYHDSSKGTLKLLWEDEWRSMGITQVCNASGRAGHTGLWRRDRCTDTDSAWKLLTRSFAESRLGALRSSRTGAAHFALQVRPPWNFPCPLLLYRAAAWLVPVRSRNRLTRATGGRSTINHLHNERQHEYDGCSIPTTRVSYLAF